MNDIEKERLILGLLDLEQQNSSEDVLKAYMRQNKAPDDIVDIYFNKDDNALASFRQTQPNRILDLRNSLPRGRLTGKPTGRDPRNLDRGAGLAGGASAGALAAGGNALAGAASGLGGAVLSGELLSEQKPFSSSGQLGGAQQPGQTARENPTDFSEKVRQEQEEEREREESGEIKHQNRHFGNDPNDDRQESIQQDLTDNLNQNTDTIENQGDVEGGRETLDHDPSAPTNENFEQVSQNQPTNTEPTEMQQGITTMQTDPNIEVGKENIPDVSLFKQMIHIGAEYSFDYLKAASGQGASIEFAQQIAKKFFNIEFSNVVDIAYNAIINNKLTDIGSLKGNTPDRIKLKISDAELGEHAIINNACLYPLLVVAFKLYLVKEDVEMGYMSDIVFKNGLEYLLKKFVKLSQIKIDYIMFLWSNYPKLLTDAYINNKESINIVSVEQKEAIEKYHTQAIQEYDRMFKPNKFLEDTKRYEHGGTELNQMLINLANPVFLFEIAKVFEAVDEFILNIQNNRGLLLGLMGLLYSKAVGEGTNMGDALLSNARVDGLVYYNRQTSAKQKSNLEIELLKNANEEVEEKIVNGVSYIIFRGTSFGDKDFLTKDFMSNIMNLASSDELFKNKEFNSRIVKASSIIEKREKEGVPVKLISYSLGGIYSLYMSSIFPEIPSNVYSPVLSNNIQTKELMKGLKEQNANLKINYIENDPISVNIEQYQDDFNILKKKKSRFFNNHDLNNYLF